MSSNNGDQEAVLAKLDTIIAIMQLAFKDRIDVARRDILSDAVSACILEKTAGDWIDAGSLRAQVAEETKQSERTVGRRIAALIGQRALDQSGSGPKIRYRATGLI